MAIQVIGQIGERADGGWIKLLACKDWLLAFKDDHHGDRLQKLDHHHTLFDDVAVDDHDVNDAHLDADDVDRGGGDG